MLIEFRLGEREQVEGNRKAWCKATCVFELRAGLLISVKINQDTTSVIVRRCGICCKLLRFGKLIERGLEPIAVGKCDPEVQVGFRGIWLNFHDATKTLDGVARLPQPLLDHA